MDIVLDTNVLSDLIAQYYSPEFSHSRKFHASRFISSPMAREINLRVKWHYGSYDYDNDEHSTIGLVIASTFAFVEIARKFDEIAGGRYSVEQFRAFIEQPPDWFFSASVDTSLAKRLCHIPAEVELESGSVVPIEVADALHVATALSRDKALLAVTDKRIRRILSIANILVQL